MPKIFDNLSKTHDLTGQQMSMRSKDKQDDTRADERRLMPYYGNKAEGTPIKAGETVGRKKKPAQQFSPKPFDAISGSRQSGPVRPRGKQKRGAGQDTYKALGLESQSTADFEHSERPTKRQRRNPNSQETPQKTINISDDEVMEQSAHLSQIPSSERPKRTAETNRHFSKMENGNCAYESPKGSNRQGHISSDDERFTENAAKERRDMSNDSEDPSQNSKSGTLKSVEIQLPKMIHEKNTTTSSSFQSQIISADGGFDRAESPDELQGAATTQPVPAALPRSSPTDIRSTEFSPSTSQGNRNRKKSKSRKKSQSRFKAVLVRDGINELLASNETLVGVHFDKLKHILEFTGNTNDSSHQFSVPVRRIVQVTYGNDPSCKIRLKLSKTEPQIGSIGPIDMELSSPEEKDVLCGLFRDITPQPKDSQWMNNAFRNDKWAMAHHANKPKRPSSEDVPEPASESKVETVKRQKLSASLEVDDGNNAPSNNADKDRSKASAPADGSNETADHGAHSHPSRENVSNTVEIPVKKATPERPSHGRETRSTRSLPATVVCDDDDGEDHTPQPALGEESKRWENPLVYPRFGKKKAEVDAQDRERLRDNEFLNDNLIGFYIRFLEDHLARTNKEAAKKVYFFNSYFYATLTNKRPINYESVQKWTRTVDIFSHDYVVVPINESAHWYVAIICNLPNLQRVSKEGLESDEAPPEHDQKPPAQGEAEIQAIPETPVCSQDVAPGPEEAKGEEKLDADPAKEEMARQSMAAMTLLDKGVPASDEDWPEKDENLNTCPARFSSPPKTRGAQQKGQKNTPKSKASPRKPKKQKKKPHDPRDPGDPVIITFDSLDLARSPTIRNLRLYLSEEAKSKKGIDIDTSLMAGLRAQAIPLQNNYSDCGLYLLAYLEKFVQDPDVFVSRLLRREMSVNVDWPPLSSGHLRLRLRKFLDDLYDEQEQLSCEKAGKKRAMADNRPISFLLAEQEPEPNTADPEDNPDADEPEKAPESATPPPPPPESNTNKSPEGKAEPSTATGPLKTPDSPARNLRQRKNHNGPNNGPPKAVRSVRALFNKVSQHTESGADRDVVEVPDSQEHNHVPPIITDLSLPTQKKNPDETDLDGPIPVSANNVENRNPTKDIVTVDDDDSEPPVVVVENRCSQPQVEVQIRETPPSEMKSTKKH